MGREAVDRLVGFAEERPPAAQVERVEILDEKPEGFVGFRTRYLETRGACWDYRTRVLWILPEIPRQGRPQSLQ